MNDAQSQYNAQGAAYAAGLANQNLVAWAWATARGLVSNWEHGTDEHRQWLRDVATPDIAAALLQARREGAATATGTAP